MVNVGGKDAEVMRPKEMNNNDPDSQNYIKPIGRFFITLICSYMFSVLLVVTTFRFEWLLTWWFHLTNIVVAGFGVFYFHPITNWMRDYWDSENTNK